ncbi:DUF4369 domain-containing protein [Prevotella sp. E2-28]|uniref:DUF4369 domain-containing protein n=1 Tax=Prevotella sp. E2-28 TaxID=2913620 RepID=UPI001EDABCDE|nr:DUF4369 domain-containing protein [Prevotella sp. E2-28]UKK52943.1 DUF4369 domain-containing protein [Prevotella sp. E2-28]
MKNFLYIFLSVALMASCSDSYVIQGTSSVSRLDGSKLYLKVFKDKELTTLDSCEVVHGKFRFSGALDTVQVASLFMDNQSLMPLVVEKGDISVTIDNGQQKVSGSPLNDVLYDFLDKHTRLQNQLVELDHRYSQMLLDGIEEMQIEQTLSAEAAVIAQQEDSLVSDFVVENFDNVLAPFIFVQMASSVPQVEHIMSKAPDAFKNNPMVNEFYKSVTDGDITDKSNTRDSVVPSDNIDDATIQDILNGHENAN